MSATPSLKGSDLRYLSEIGADGLNVGSAYLKASARRLIDQGYVSVTEEGDIGGAVLSLTDQGHDALRVWQEEQDGKNAMMAALTAGLDKVSVSEQQNTLNEIANYLIEQGVREDLVQTVRNWLVTRR